MIFFKNNRMKKIIKTKEKNNKGQIQTIYKLDRVEYDICLQELSTKEAIDTWGVSIISRKQMFSDELLSIGDLVYIDENVYEIEDKLYDCFAIKNSDIKVGVING